MKLKLRTVLLALVASLFFGILGSIVIGAAIPSANQIAGPFVCPGGEMKLATSEEQPSSILSDIFPDWACVDGKTGTLTILGIFPMVLYSGAIYGFIAFLLVFILMLVNANKKPATQS